MQRSNVLIMPLVFASFMSGMMSEYEQVTGLTSGQSPGKHSKKLL
jgi:hypothetical protein